MREHSLSNMYPPKHFPATWASDTQISVWPFSHEPRLDLAIYFNKYYTDLWCSLPRRYCKRLWLLPCSFFPFLIAYFDVVRYSEKSLQTRY